MKYMFINKEAYFAQVAELNRIRMALDRAETRYHSLVNRMLDLKKQGFEKPKPEPVEPESVVIPREIMEAITRISPVKDKAYEANMAYALAHRDDWLRPDTRTAIAINILRGRIADRPDEE